MAFKFNTQENGLSNLTEKGQSLVEFAFSLVILLVLVAGIVDLGRAFFTYMALHDAAQEGAIHGALNPTDTNGIITRVRETSQHPVDLMDTSIVSVGVEATGVCEGAVMKVIVTYQDFPVTMPLMGSIIGSQTITLKASAQDTILRPPCGG